MSDVGLTRSVAIEHLPDTYRRIIGWLDADLPEDEIAKRLDLEPASVRPLVVVARAKLDRLLDEECSTAPPRI